MTDAIRRHPVAAAIFGFLLLLVFLSSVSIVPETRQGVVAQFGKPVRIINRYKEGDQFGGIGAGLAFRIPFVENIVWIDKRVRDLDMDKQQVLSAGGRCLCSLPRDRPASNVSGSPVGRPGRAGAPPDPRLAAPQ